MMRSGCFCFDVLDGMEAECDRARPVPGKEVRSGIDIIRLLLLTGCRHREICHLQWSFLQGDVLALPDTRTGPRKVYLSQEALAIINSQKRTAAPWTFPSPAKPDRPRRNVGHVRRRAQGCVAAVASAMCASMTRATPLPAMR